MSIMEHWRLAITPLSPVHMGTGQDYAPTGYVIDDGALYEFDALAALGVLPEPERRRLNGILDGRPNQGMLREVQAFFHGNRDRLIPVSRQQVRVNATIEAFYQQRVGQVSQRESSGAAVQNRLEIERTAWSPAMGTALLPGSGLKGAIRTALLNAVNADRPLPPELKSDRQGNRKLQESLFQGSFERDPLRMLRIGDAWLAQPEGFATEVRFALNRKKRPVKVQGQQVQSRAEQQGLYQLLECLPGFTPRAFEGSLSIQETGGIRSNAWPSRCFTFSEIAAACNQFYRAHFRRESDLLRSMGYLDTQWAIWIEDLLSGPVGQAVASDRAFLLRVGRHSGAESVTLNGVRNIKIMKGRGETPDYLDEAKTLWLASHERQSQRDLLPFGWVLVEPFQHAAELAPWPGPLQNQETGPWRQRVQLRCQTLLSALETEKSIEAERLRALEAAEREAREREERLAAMSDEERRIDALLQVLARERASDTLAPSSQVASERVDLLRAALEWNSDEFRRKAAEAIQETVRALPWSKKSKAERQAELARLRGPKAPE